MSDNFSNTLGATYLNIILKLIVFILGHVRHFCWYMPLAQVYNELVFRISLVSIIYQHFSLTGSYINIDTPFS